MNKLLDDISKLQLQITNKKNLENIDTELKKLPREYSKINKNTFNEFYNFENKYEKKKPNNIDIIFPEDSIRVQDMHSVDAINDEVERLHSNIEKRNNIYSNALKGSKINEIHSKLTETRKSSGFDLIDMIELYKRIDMKISDDNFDDEFCINNGNQLFGSFNKYNYINNEVEKLKNVKKYNNELNTIFDRSLEVIKFYDIEKLIIDPELGIVEDILETNLRLSDAFLDTIQQNSFILSYELTPELFSNLDEHMITNYNSLVSGINIQIDPNKLENLLKRIDMSQKYLSNIKLELKKIKKYCNSSPDLIYLSSELIPKVDSLIKKLDSIVKNINDINKENISRHITLILSIKKEYESINETIKEFYIKIVENNNNYEKLYEKFKDSKNKIRIHDPKIEEINTIMLSLDIQSNNFDKMELLKDTIRIYNNFLNKKQKISERNNHKTGYDYTALKIDLSQYGGSVNKFNDYFNKLVDISINVRKNNDISEHKIRFNNLLFYSHILYIINYTNKERIITSHINRFDVNKYLKKIISILESIKNKSDKNIETYYFFKYHYFNLKIVYDFLHKLDNSWIKPETSMCNEEIIKLYDENEMNNRIYFNLLDTKYTPSMKKAIFIFFGMKVILDKLI
jgi:hypothetical protein